jgi:hypothetical protein
VAAPSRINRFQFLSRTKKLSGSHPKKEIDNNGVLRITLVPLVTSNEPNPSNEQMEKVTMVIFDEIKALCDKYSILPVLAVRTDTSFDRVAVRCADNDYKLIDITCLIPVLVNTKCSLLTTIQTGLHSSIMPRSSLRD